MKGFDDGTSRQKAQRGPGKKAVPIGVASETMVGQNPPGLPLGIKTAQYSDTEAATSKVSWSFT